jgi:hypothetical protein
MEAIMPRMMIVHNPWRSARLSLSEIEFGQRKAKSEASLWSDHVRRRPAVFVTLAMARPWRQTHASQI